MKSNGKSARIRARVVVGNCRKTCRIREPRRYRRRFALDMRCPRKPACPRAWSEASAQQNTLRMRRSEAGMNPENGIKLLDQLFAESDNSFVPRKRHIISFAPQSGAFLSDARSTPEVVVMSRHSSWHSMPKYKKQ